jgi:F-type H+-transporting ATPase subunit delta
MAARKHTHPVARVYAQALLDVAADRGDALGEQFNAFLQLLRAQPDLRRFLESPAIAADHKLAALEALRGQLDDTLVDFLCVVVSKQRVAELDEIGAAYAELADSAAGRVLVRVASAVPLSAAQQQKLDATLRQKLQRDPVLDTQVQPELIAGLVVQVGDRVYDGTLRSWLQRLRKEMVRSSGYED